MINRYRQITLLTMLSKQRLRSLLGWFSGNNLKRKSGLSPTNPVEPVYSNSSACVWQMDREA
jgi:hypothetical protein